MTGLSTILDVPEYGGEMANLGGPAPRWSQLPKRDATTNHESKNLYLSESKDFLNILLASIFFCCDPCVLKCIYAAWLIGFERSGPVTPQDFPCLPPWRMDLVVMSVLSQQHIWHCSFGSLPTNWSYKRPTATPCVAHRKHSHFVGSIVAFQSHVLNWKSFWNNHQSKQKQS